MIRHATWPTKTGGCRTVLNPASPPRQGARYLIIEQVGVRDQALYHSVLAAIADGHTTRSTIARFIGGPADTLRHLMTVLEDASLIVREADVFRRNRSYHRIAEPHADGDTLGGRPASVTSSIMTRRTGAGMSSTSSRPTRETGSSHWAKRNWVYGWA